MFTESGMTEFVLSHVINMGDWNGSNRFANEVNVLSFDILYNHDTFFSQEMERKFVGRVFQDTFLDQKDVSS